MKLNMKLLALININLIAPCYNFIWKNTWEKMNLSVTTRFEGIEEYYRSLRIQHSLKIQPREVTEAEKRARIKKELCKNIFTSHYFKMYKKEWVNVDDENVQIDLEENYPDIFYKIFRRSDTTAESFVSYENGYLPRKIYVGDISYQEFSFVCPVHDTESRTIEEYFISREYDVNLVEVDRRYHTTGKFIFTRNKDDVLDDRNYAIAGRFIFAHDDVRKLVLLAMAEEPGSSLLPWILRNALVTNAFNLTERYNEDLFATLTENPELDPVCQLSDGFKLRLCAILFGAVEFKKTVSFLPTMKNVLPKCQKKRISIIGTKFVTEFLDQYIRPSWGRIFEEWVIGCHATDMAGTSKFYYVSRGMWPNSVFVYTGSGDKDLSVYNYFYNVSVADE